MATCATHNIPYARERSPFRINIYLPILYLYFFFNSVGLPFGLQYTAILTPFFYIWLRNNQQKWIISRFILCSLPFVAAHLALGVDYKSYVVSLCLIFTVYLTIYAFCIAVKKSNGLRGLFRNVIISNFIFACCAIPFRNSTYSDLFWWNTFISEDLTQIPRLKLLTYEASYYATLLVPFFLYSYFRMLFSKKSSDYLLFVMIAIPLALSLSFGVISGIACTLVMIHFIYFRKIFRVNKFYVLIILPPIFFIVAILAIKSSFGTRLIDVLSGNDQSGTGRVVWSYILSYQVAHQKSIIWGVGFGQVKLYFDLMVEFMQMTFQRGWMNASLYNGIADMLASTGIVGVTLKLATELILFAKTKCYDNYYRFSLFIFIFIYQFTGSYLTNVAEYIIWGFAFIELFPEFALGGKKELKLVTSPIQMETAI